MTLGTVQSSRRFGAIPSGISARRYAEKSAHTLDPLADVQYHLHVELTEQGDRDVAASNVC